MNIVSLLSAASGCAQLVGIEEWRPESECEGPDVDPELCELSASCSECLNSQKTACDALRTDCLNDPNGICKTIYSCANSCGEMFDPVACIKNCCEKNAGDMKYDDYITCQCNACDAECGALTYGCDMFCNM